MLDKYEEQLEKLKHSIDELGSKIIQAIDYCEDAVNTLDVKKFDLTRETLNSVEQDANLIDQGIVRILALYGPEAAELRELVSYLKITSELVRINDNIKSFTKRMKSHINNDLDFESIKQYSTLLARSAFMAIAFSIESLSVTSADEANELYRKTSVEESKTDDLYSILEKNIVSEICQHIELSADCIQVLSTMRKLERMADRSVNITKLMLFARVGGEIKPFG